jgi:spore coat polysaccharide biosynthesis protein SpsF (cytidylyltransferase family)
VETVARDQKSLVQSFCPFVTFDLIQNNVQLHINTREDYKMYMGKTGVYDGNVNIIATSEIYKVLTSVYYVSEGQITHHYMLYLVKLRLKEMHLCCLVLN